MNHGQKLTQSNQVHHGFASGLLLGAVLGSVAYYLYGTEKGAEIKNRVLAEYEKAKAELSPELVAGLGTSLEGEKDLDVTVSVQKRSERQSLLSRVKQLFGSEISHKATEPDPPESVRTKRFFKKSSKK